MDLALLGPSLESVGAHAQFVRQVANPPLVDRQTLSGASPRAETESVHQVPGTPRGESVRAASGRAEALPVQALRDLCGALPGRDGGLHQPSHPREVGQSLVTTDWSPESVLRRDPTDPLDADHDVLSVTGHRRSWRTRERGSADWIQFRSSRTSLASVVAIRRALHDVSPEDIAGSFQSRVAYAMPS